MKNRVLALFLTIAMCIAFLPASVFAEGEGSIPVYEADYYGTPDAIAVNDDGENLDLTPGSNDYIIIHKDGTDIRCQFKCELNPYSEQYEYVLYNIDENDNNYIDTSLGWAAWYVSPTSAYIEIGGYSYDADYNMNRWIARARLYDVYIYNEVKSIEFKPAITTLYSEDIRDPEEGDSFLSIWKRSHHSHGDETWWSTFAVGDQLVVTYDNGRTKTYTNKDYYNETWDVWDDGFFSGNEYIVVQMYPIEEDSLKIGSNEVIVEHHAQTTIFNFTVTDQKPTPVNPQPTPVVNPTYVAPVVPAEIQDLPAVKISKPKAAKKAVTVKWKKVSKKNLKKIGGIEIQVATDPDFTNIVKSTTAGKKKASKKIKGLTSKQTYWVRIRAYNNAADGKHVSAWKSKKFKAK